MIILNGRFMTQPLTGVQRFARGVTRQLLSLRDDVRVVVPSQAEILGEYNGIPFTPIGNRNGHLWEQLDLPAHAGKNRALLLNLCSTAPIMYRRQIVTHHDITYVRHPESFTRSFRFLYRTLAPIFLRSSSAIITVSEFSKQEISTFYRIAPSRINVVSNAADDEFAPSESAPENPAYLLAVSSPSAHKNFRRLIEAYNAWTDDSKPRLRVVGSSAKTLASPVIERGNHHVEFVGRVTDDELVALYQGARGFIFPSLYEGFGIPPIEAQSCGIPVAAADIPVMREVLGDSALLFDPQSLKSITQALQKVSSDQRSRSLLIAAGRDNASRYSWASSAKSVSDLIDSDRVHAIQVGNRKEFAR